MFHCSNFTHAKSFVCCRPKISRAASDVASHNGLPQAASEVPSSNGLPDGFQDVITENKKLSADLMVAQKEIKKLKKRLKELEVIIPFLYYFVLACYIWSRPGSETINAYWACLSAQLTICAQKLHNFVCSSTLILRFVLSRVFLFLFSLGPRSTWNMHTMYTWNGHDMLQVHAVQYLRCIMCSVIYLLVFCLAVLAHRRAMPTLPH